MTGWRISAGYPSQKSMVETWEAIKTATEKITGPELIDQYYIGLPGDLRTATAREEAAEIAIIMTEKQGRDLSVTIHEDEKIVRLLASGAAGREMKERMRRAFIRCILRRTADYNVDVTSH